MVRAAALLALANVCFGSVGGKGCGLAPAHCVARWRARFVESGAAGVPSVAPGRGYKPQSREAVVEAT